MRAVAYIVNMCAGRAQFLAHPAVQIVDRRLLVNAVGHAGLVGHDEDVVTALVEPTDCVDSAGQPAEIRDAVQVADIVVEGAVAIKKYRRTPRQRAAESISRGG
jgi:2-keto-4-pentenoate hydratase/2-oxohepta-3-ene-1,7-dioic acid hydratase in catechol pathway